jgi:hypothetical protein
LTSVRKGCKEEEKRRERRGEEGRGGEGGGAEVKEGISVLTSVRMGCLSQELNGPMLLVRRRSGEEEGRGEEGRGESSNRGSRKEFQF